MTESVNPPRIAGWLLLPLAWLIMTMLTSALVVAMYLSPLFDTELRTTLFTHASQLFTQWAISLLTAGVVWVYSIWVCWMFCKRSRRLPRHYILWLLMTVLLALKRSLSPRWRITKPFKRCCCHCWRRRYLCRTSNVLNV